MSDQERYNHLFICDVNIPKSGVKRFTLEGIDLFVRPLGSFVYFYEVSTKRLLLSIQKCKRDKGFEIILNRIQEVKDMKDAISLGVP